MVFLFLVKLNKRDSRTQTWLTQHCVEVVGYTLDASTLIGTLSSLWKYINSIQQRHRPQSDCFLFPATVTHTQTHTGQIFYILVFYAYFSEYCRGRGWEKNVFLQLLKGRRGIICFPSICVHVSGSEQTPHTGTLLEFTWTSLVISWQCLTTCN